MAVIEVKTSFIREVLAEHLGKITPAMALHITNENVHKYVPFENLCQSVHQILITKLSKATY